MSAVYFLIAAAWIFFSDRIAASVFSAETQPAVQSFKGLAFVLVTSVALYFLARRYHLLVARSEQEYRRLFQDNPHPMWVYDLDTLQILMANSAAVAQYGYTIAEFRQMTILDIRPSEDGQAVRELVQTLEPTGFFEAGVWRHQTKNGDVFFARVSSHSTTFGKYRNARVVLAIDVDEQIHSERKVQDSERKLKGLINNSDDLIWMLDADGFIVAANDAFLRICSEYTGLNINLSENINIHHLPETALTRNWESYFESAAAGKKVKVEEKIELGDHTEYFEIILNPVFNEQQKLFGVGCFARDITQRKVHEEQITNQLNRLKEVAWMQSHELRRPLANILGLMELIRLSDNKELSSSELIQHMESSCHDLDAVVKKIVDRANA